MYLHIGEEYEILLKNIIGIFNIDVFKDIDKKNHLIHISSDKPKSVIIVNERETLLYLSPISAITLNKRWQEIQRSIGGFL